MVGAVRDRHDLLGGAGAGQHALLHQTSGNAGLLLRERGMLASTNAALDEVMGTAQVRGGQAGVGTRQAGREQARRHGSHGSEQVT